MRDATFSHQLGPPGLRPQDAFWALFPDESAAKSFATDWDKATQQTPKRQSYEVKTEQSSATAAQTHDSESLRWKPSGATNLKERLLLRAGWPVLPVPFFEWHADPGQQRQYLQDLLSPHLRKCPEQAGVIV